MPKKSYVYFIQAKISKRVKIGKANTPETRLKELQTGSHEKLSILGIIECRDAREAGERETELHRQFSDLRLEGEWFDFGPDLIAFCCHWDWIETELAAARDLLQHFIGFRKSVVNGFTQRETTYHGA